MAVRLSALCADRPLSPERFLALISVRGLIDPKAIVQLEGLFVKYVAERVINKFERFLF
jgi:hypothetical protein